MIKEVDLVNILKILRIWVKVDKKVKSNSNVYKSRVDVIKKSGSPSVQKSGSPSDQKSGSPSVQKSGSPSVQKSGSPSDQYPDRRCQCLWNLNGIISSNAFQVIC